MNRMSSIVLLAILAVTATVASAESPSQSNGHEYNGPYTGACLNRTAFPIGGMGAGMFCIEGTGAISHMSVRNRMEFFHEPCTFAAVCVKGEPNVARVLEGPIPDWKYFGAPNTGNGAPGMTYGFPRFPEASFLARFPFATVDLRDAALPLDVTITGWSPFIPGDADNSSLPVGALEYRFTNTSNKDVEAVFSFNTKNFMASGGGDSIKACPGGFMLCRAAESKPEDNGAFAVFVDEDAVVVDHCWFKGGWWDSLTLAWRNVAQANLMENPPAEGSAPGASLFLPFKLAPGESKTIRLMTAWYVPETRIRVGDSREPAFATGPSTGTGPGQQTVSGFLGKRLVNTFDPNGDGATGTLTSKKFRIRDRFIHFLIAGGSDETNTALQLQVDGRTVRAAAGRDTETLAWHSWDLADFQGKTAQLRIVDNSTGGWGHVCVDNIIASDEPIDALRKAGGNGLKRNADAETLADFEGDDYGDWTPNEQTGKCCSATRCELPAAEYHAPWYAGRFDGIEQVADYWRENCDDLRAKSELFKDTFYDTTLPAEVVEAVAANLTILKSPTVLRQTDGRLWCFEGCGDSFGCCHGSCTHVWNYAQALPHLFPDLERSLRRTEFNESSFPDGRQAFRANLPIRPGGVGDHASDGQLGGIMKMYREWRISGDSDWLRAYWPKIRKSLDYMIVTLDPRGTGLLEESHHNTYDINYFGPDGHCGSFYLGALAAAVKMGEFLGDDVSGYIELLAKGATRLETELFNGEYFYQKIMKDELDNPWTPQNPDDNGSGYSEIVRMLNEQGPKYQYGTGCLSDGVLGFWMARVCGIQDDIVSPQKVRSNLLAIHKYNLKRDLATHANPQRPGYAMGDEGGLLLCTWPQGGALAIPFVYSDEVWTGIEYQVAAHLMMEGFVEQGLEIVRICRDRYDGVRRNPFNEYECGHWYARAMSSYALIQGLTGARYDAVDRTLHIDSKVGDFRAFISTATGFGTVGLKNGQVKLEVKSGEIDVRNTIVH